MSEDRPNIEAFVPRRTLYRTGGEWKEVPRIEGGGAIRLKLAQDAADRIPHTRDPFILSAGGDHTNLTDEVKAELRAAGYGAWFHWVPAPRPSHRTSTTSPAVPTPQTMVAEVSAEVAALREEVARLQEVVQGIESGGRHARTGG